NVALPYMQGSFAASVDEITWVLTSYLVANGIMIPMTGFISARFGRKRYFMISVLVFVVASALCGVAQSLPQMVVFRLLQGAAGAAMIPSSQAILMETFPPNEQALAMATWGLGLMVAPILGPTLGGWITMNWSWRWNFYINLPVGAMASLMVYLFVHDPSYLRKQKATGGRIDWVAIILLTIGLGFLQIVLDRGQRADWFDAAWVRYFTLVSIGSFIVLTLYELRFPEPILQLRLFKIPEFTVSVLMVTVMMSALYGVNLMNPLFLQELMGYDAWQAGLAVASRGIGVTVAMIMVGQLARAGYDTRPLIGVGCVIAAYAAWQMSHWDLTVSFSAMQWPIVLFGVGGGLLFPLLTAAAFTGVSRERMGYASSLYNMLRNTGAAIGVSLVSNMLTAHQQIHQADLARHFSIFDAWRMSHSAARMPGAPSFNVMNQLVTGQKQGLEMVYGTIQTQASLLSFNDVYRLFAFAVLIIAPLFIFFRRPPTKHDVPVH
ncbi:MAG: DHA2 family efflux MFS transporter permease subunit, partial [Candidatus Binataceae bacterium]